MRPRKAETILAFLDLAAFDFRLFQVGHHRPCEVWKGKSKQNFQLLKPAVEWSESNEPQRKWARKSCFRVHQKHFEKAYFKGLWDFGRRYVVRTRVTWRIQIDWRNFWRIKNSEIGPNMLNHWRHHWWIECVLRGSYPQLSSRCKWKRRTCSDKQHKFPKDERFSCQSLRSI